MRASRHQAPVVAVLAASMLLAPGAAGASTPIASPAAWPQTPDPAACVTAPVAAGAILAVLDEAATPVASPAAVFATPSALAAPGVPADAATTEAIHQTLFQLFACANAGDLLRVASFYTDPFLVDFLGGVPRADLEAVLAMPAQPLPDAERRIIRGIGDVDLLPDGRARVVIILDEPSDPRSEEPDAVLLRQVNGQWLVDEIHEM